VKRGEEQLKMFEEIFTIFREKAVPEEYIKFFHNKLIATRTEHSTIANPEREKIYEKIRNNPELRRKILQIYYFDYILFDFNIVI